MGIYLQSITESTVFLVLSALFCTIFSKKMHAK